MMQTRTDAGKQLRTLYIHLVALVPVFTQLLNFAQMIMMKQQAIIQQQEMRAIAHSRQLAIEDAEQAHRRTEEERRLRQLAEEEHQRQVAEEQRLRQLAESRYVHMRTINRVTLRPVPDSWIYIATSPTLALQHRFKPGSSSGKLRKRLSTYNTGRAEGDLMFYSHVWRCYHAHSIDQMLQDALENYADKTEKEMVIIPLCVLLPIVERFVAADLHAGEMLSTFIDSFDAHMSATPEVPHVLDLDEIEPRRAKAVRHKKEGSRKKHEKHVHAADPAPAASSAGPVPAEPPADPALAASSTPEPAAASSSQPVRETAAQRQKRYRERCKSVKAESTPDPACAKKSRIKYASEEERAAARKVYDRRYNEKRK
jgi:hypothetical protein